MRINDDNTGLANLWWNMFRNSLPSFIIDYYNNYIERHGLPRMDCNQKGKSASNPCRIKL